MKFSEILRSLIKWSNTYGYIYKIWIGPHLFVMLSSPENVAVSNIFEFFVLIIYVLVSFTLSTDNENKIQAEILII